MWGARCKNAVDMRLEGRRASISRNRHASKKCCSTKSKEKGMNPPKYNDQQIFIIPDYFNQTKIAYILQLHSRVSGSETETGKGYCFSIKFSPI